VERHLEDRVLRVLESLRQDLKLSKVALLDSLACGGGEELEGRSVRNLSTDIGDNVLPLRGDFLERLIGSTVAHGEGVWTASGTLTELLDSLSSVGLVAVDLSLGGRRRVIAEHDRHTAVVLEVLTDTGKVLHDLNTLRLEVLGIGNTAPLEDLRRVNGTSGQDDLMLGSDGLDFSASDGTELDGRDLLILVNDKTKDLVGDEKVEVGERVSDASVVADTCM
jgi:hypothetical protein